MKPHFIAAALAAAMFCAEGAHAQSSPEKPSGNVIKQPPYFGYCGLKPKVDLDRSDDGPGLVGIDYEIKQPPEVHKVGQIFVVGNDVTQDRVILRLLNLYPGQTLRYPELELGKAALMRSNLFEMKDEAARPDVSVIQEPSKLDDDGVFKDILVRVKETTTGQMSFNLAVNSRGLPVIRFGVEERNFDLLRIPESLADVWDGRAFRGAGQKVRIELIEFGLFGCSLPCLSLRENLSLVVSVSDSFVELLGDALTELGMIEPAAQEPAAPAAEPAVPAEPIPAGRKMPSPKMPS